MTVPGVSGNEVPAWSFMVAFRTLADTFSADEVSSTTRRLASFVLALFVKNSRYTESAVCHLLYPEIDQSVALFGGLAEWDNVASYGATRLCASCRIRIGQTPP